MANKQESPDQAKDLPPCPMPAGNVPPLGPIGNVPANERKN